LGAERKSAYIDEKNKLLTAYHEVHNQPHESRVEISKLMDGGREDMPWQLFIQMVPCPSTKSRVCRVVMRWALYVSMVTFRLENYADSRIYQTSQLPEDDRYSVTQTEFKATIDVCMGGRVAEGLSEFFSPRSPTTPDLKFQFMELGASQAAPHLISSMPLVLQPLWSRLA
jgi:ATP-dependent metalloprotease